MIKIPAEATVRKMPAGGYICRIVKATSAVNRYSEPCVLLYLDVAEGEYANYFGEIYARRLAAGFKDYPCVYKQSVGRIGSQYFKGLIGLIEASNAGYVSTAAAGADWDERELEGLLIGVVFREKEFTNSRGRRRLILVVQELKSVEKIRRVEYEPPARLVE